MTGEFVVRSNLLPVSSVVIGHVRILVLGATGKQSDILGDLPGKRAPRIRARSLPVAEPLSSGAYSLAESGQPIARSP
jgi:hypothetical protein